MHCGTQVPVSGPNAYYGEFSKILVFNRGVHEPLEEFVFQSLIPFLPPTARMIELGSYWAHYSMWLKTKRPAAVVTMVEADELGLKAGRSNFEHNGFEGNFIHAFVGAGGFELDKYFATTGVPKIEVVHADIQGYEAQMLDGARKSLDAKLVDYLLISTHSQHLHHLVCQTLQKNGYRVEVQADFDNETTAMDGFVFASSPCARPIFENFKLMGRSSIALSSLDDRVAYLERAHKAFSREICSSLPVVEPRDGLYYQNQNAF